jgi:predicted double-glycine peptidase
VCQRNPGRRCVCAAATALAAITAAGCHSPIAVSHHSAGILGSGEFDVIAEIDVPRVRGAAGCGAQALAAAVAHVDDDVDAAALADELPWHEEGALAVELLVEARQRGCEATIARGDLLTLSQHVDAGVPVIVLFDSAYEVHWLFTRYDMPKVMHWAVVSGVHRDGEFVLLAARDGRHHKVRRAEFERRWAKSDYCMIAVRAKPGEDDGARGVAGTAGIQAGSKMVPRVRDWVTLTNVIGRPSQSNSTGPA